MRHRHPRVSERDVQRYAPPNPSCRRHDPGAAERYIAFEVSGKAKIPVGQHASREHTAMHLLKCLWQWESDRRTERRMLKGHGVYRTQTNQGHIRGRKMPFLPISSW